MPVAPGTVQETAFLNSSDPLAEADEDDDFVQFLKRALATATY